MNILDMFADEMNRTYSVYALKEELDADDEVVQGWEAVSSLSNIQCAFYTGSAANRLVSDRYKTKATGVVISEVHSVPDMAKLVLNTGEEFIVLHADNVMEQDEVLVLTVGTENYGESV